MPAFAVIVPVHNKAEHVERSLGSVLEQSWQDFELIVVDDASTDDSAARIAAVRDPRIRILRRETPGPGGYAARNLATSEAAADWCAFLDADDAWLPDHLSSMARLIEAQGDEIGCFFAGFQMEQADGTKTLDWYSQRHAGHGAHRLELEPFLDQWLRISDTPMRTSATVVRRDILLEIGGFPAGRCRRGGDKDTWLRMMARTDAMYSGAATMRYATEATSKVTRTASMNVTPCATQTIRRMIGDPQFSGIRHRLKKIVNNEIYAYARIITRNSRIKRELFSNFYVSVNPFIYLFILVLWITPLPVILRLRQVRQLFVRP